MKTFLKELNKAIITMVIVTALIFLIIFFVQGELKEGNIKAFLTYNFAYGVPLSFAHGYLFDFLKIHYPWKSFPRKRIVLAVLGSILITISIVFIINIILWIGIWGSSFDALFSERNVIFYVVAVIISLIISTVSTAIAFYKNIKQQELKEEQLRKENLRSELNLLNSQIDPHFLFNSFNVLHGLIEEDPTKAQQLLTKLSGIYRYILDNKDSHLNTIEAEITFGNKYLDLQKARFENSINVHIDINQDLAHYKIPSLSLQILLENAIKHNAFEEDDPLNIFIRTEEDHLVVSNSLNKRASVMGSNGIGLQNIKDRYQLLSENTLEIAETGTEYTVKLPLIME